MATTNSFVNYFGRDFDTLRQNLITYATTRHSDKFAYLNDSSPDMLYLEMISYFGDMFGYQLDRSFLEVFRTTAQSDEAVIRIAQNHEFHNYFPKPSSLVATISINIPAVVSGDGTSMVPDSNYYITILSGLKVQATNGTMFECLEEINFSSADKRTIIPNYDGNNRLINFTVQKSIVLSAGETRIQRFYVSSKDSKPFLEVIVNDVNVSQIVGVVVVNGDTYIAPSDDVFRDINQNYIEVENLSQNKIFVPINNDQESLNQIIDLYTDMTLNSGEWISTNRRFIVRRDKNNQTSLIFGSTLLDNTSWTEKLSNVDSQFLASFSLTQILNNYALGQIPPADSTIFIKYRTGAGTETNIPTLTDFQILDRKFVSPPSTSNLNTVQQVRNSIKITSLTPAEGGRDFLSKEEIRNMTASSFASNDRLVTYSDISAIISKMPSQFGQPFRVSYEEIKPKVLNYTQVKNYLNTKLTDILTLQTTYDREAAIEDIKTFLTDLPTQQLSIENSLGISFQQTSDNILNNTPSLWLGQKSRIHVLGLDSDGNPSSIYKDSNGLYKSSINMLKQNIKNYLVEKRLIGDWFDIVDARVVNFQVQFKIIADRKNKQKVLIDCLTALRSYFATTNWQLNQPIYISNVSTVIQQIEGVANLVDIKFINIFETDLDSGLTYSPKEVGRYRNNNSTALNNYNNKFEMKAVNNVILSYPDTFLSVKYSSSDIIGIVIN